MKEALQLQPDGSDCLLFTVLIKYRDVTMSCVFIVLFVCCFQYVSETGVCTFYNLIYHIAILNSLIHKTNQT